MKRFTLCFLLLISSFKSQSQVITIGEARTKPNGTTVTVRGMITNGSELGTIRYLQDGTGALAAYSTTMSSVQRGDSVEVTGVVAPYNNLFELTPIDSFSIISSGNQLPDPKLLTMAAGYAEAYEEQLVRFDNTSFLSNGNFQTASANYEATDGSVDSEQVRINSTTNIAGTTIPFSQIDLVLIMSQYQSTYQLLPRDLNDFLVPGNPPIITTKLFQHNITPTSFEVSFSTQNAGNTILYFGTTNSLGNSVSDMTMITNHNLAITGLNAAALYYVKAASVSITGDTSFSAVVPMMTQSLSSGAIKCYFVRSVDTTIAQNVNATSLGEATADTIIAYMNRSKYTMDIAIYDMDNLNGIVDAINAAYNRGVAVRVIGDGNNMQSGAWNLLNIGSSNKKLSPTSSNYNIMHNKFMIIDANSSDANDAIIWTGSTNFTDEQVKTDANNIIIFQDQSLAKAYEMEFDEMWSGVFGPYKTDNTPKEFNIGGNRVELYFSPSDNTQAEITRTIASADHDMEFCIYQYTRPEISDSIDEQITAGVWSGGVIDDTTGSTNTFSLLEQSMSNTLFLADFTYLVHNKYLLVDANAPALDPLVLTGSHNWTYSANTKNDENTVVVHNASIANQYYQEWVARYHDVDGTELPSYILDVNSLNNENASLKIFPNPAISRIYLVMNSERNSSLTIQINDIAGKILLEESIQNNSPLNISSLQDGMYSMRVIQDGKLFEGKFIVAR